jgi:hypothetical protein
MSNTVETVTFCDVKVASTCVNGTVPVALTATKKISNFRRLVTSNV